MTNLTYEQIQDHCQAVEKMLASARKIASTQTPEGLRLAQFYIEPCVKNLHDLAEKIDKMLEQLDNGS